MSNKVSLKIELITDDKGVIKATVDAEELNNVVQEVAKSADKAQSAFSDWAQTTMALSAITDLADKLNGHIQAAAQSFDDFDQAMRAANTMMGLGEDAFQDMKDSLSEMSKEIPKTRAELAEGLYQVISNGVSDPVEALKLLETSARSSVGGIADLSQVVGVTATIWKNYGLDASAAADIQDKIQLTAKNGVTSFEQLAAALPAVSGNAATLGVSIDELLASFATLTGVSGNTAAVSTQLGAIFTALVKPSTEAAKMAEEMGIKFDAAAIQSAGGFEEFLQQLNVAVQNYSKTSGVLEQEVYGRLFGSAEALKALIPLQGELADKYEENVGAMVNSSGTMDEAFGQMAQTGNSVKQMLQNSVQAMTDWATGIASSMAPMMNYITAAGDMASSIGALYKGITSVIPAVKAFGAALIANPIGMAVAALAALAAALVVVYNNCEDFRKVVDETFGEISRLVGEIIDELKPALKEIWDLFSGLGGEMGSIFIEPLKLLVKVLGWLVKMIAENVLKKLRALKTLFIAISTAISSVNKKIKDFFGIEEPSVAGAVKNIGELACGVAKLNKEIDKTKKAGGTIAAAVSAKDNSKDKNYAPEGSLKALQKDISAVQAKIDIEVDEAKRGELYKELEELKKQKLIIEAKMKLDAEGFKAGTEQLAMKVGDVMNDKISKGGLKNVDAMIKKSNDAVKAQEALTKAEQKRQDAQLSGYEITQLTAQGFSQMGDAIGGAAGSVMQWAAQQVSAIAQVIPQIVALCTAKQGEGIAEATASGAGLPFPANIAAIGAGIAAVMAAFAKMPKFAAGGIISGPTVGLMGEYPGASNNPEVVAPLNKLKSLIGEGGAGGTVDFKIQGRALRGVLVREQSIRNRQ